MSPSLPSCSAVIALKWGRKIVPSEAHSYLQTSALGWYRGGSFAYSTVLVLKLRKCGQSPASYFILARVVLCLATILLYL